MSALIPELLARRARGGGGGTPLVTYYDLGTGERTELSAVTFANWVAKTANLLAELAVDSGDRVRLDLTKRFAGHWVTFVWQAACWQVGAVVAAVPPGDSVAVTVVGPDWTGYETSLATELVACSLHPLGLGFDAGVLPTGVLDYALEVRSQPDAYGGPPPDADALAWTNGERSLTQADLVAVKGAPERRLVRPADPWTTCHDGLIVPLVTGGSAVVVTGDGDLGHISDVEGATGVGLTDV